MIRYEISATTTTSAPPERIFGVLDDFGSWPSWMPAFERIQVELPSGRGLGAGYRFRLRSGVMHTDMEVIDFGPLTRATSFRIGFPPLSGVNRCQVVPLENGRFRIERVDELALPSFLANMITPAQSARFERLAGDFLRALKRTAEAGPRQPALRSNL